MESGSSRLIEDEALIMLDSAIARCINGDVLGETNLSPMENKTRFGERGCLGSRRLLRKLAIEISDRDDDLRWCGGCLGTLADMGRTGGGDREDEWWAFGNVAEDERPNLVFRASLP